MGFLEWLFGDIDFDGDKEMGEIEDLKARKGGESIRKRCQKLKRKNEN